jgi:membrane-associated phospholipid phosphatase
MVIPSHNQSTMQKRFSIALGSLFLVLTMTVHLRLWQSLDWAALAAMQNALPRAVDLPFSILSLLGSAEVTAIIFLAMLFAIRAGNRLPMILAFGVATVIELIGKRFVHQPITPQELLRYIPIVPILSSGINPGFSFPSGHALRTTFIVIVLASLTTTHNFSCVTKNIIYAVLILIEVVMLISRVYLAEHWLTDVIGGAILGAAFALVVLKRQ